MYLVFIFLLLLQGFLAAMAYQNVVIVLDQRLADCIQHLRIIRSQKDGFLIVMRCQRVCHLEEYVHSDTQTLTPLELELKLLPPRPMNKLSVRHPTDATI